MTFTLCLGGPGLAIGQGTPARVDAAGTQTGNLATEELYKTVVPSIMTIVVDKPEGLSTGTAFLVKDGLALTAWHLVKDGRRAVAKFSDGEEFEVSGLVDKDEHRDLALIRVKVFGRTPLAAGTEPAVGSKAYVVGSPKGLEFSVSDGLISQIQTIAGVKQFQFTCPASPGNSGGPLINGKAQVVGVVSWQVRDGQNLNFAVPISYALGLDTTLPTQPFGSVKSVGRLSSVMDSESFGPILVKAFVAEYDAFITLRLDADRVVAKNGFKSGVGGAVYAAQTILEEHLQQLDAISSSDTKKEALRHNVVKVLGSTLQALDLYVKAIRETGVAGGWSSTANELFSRSTGAPQVTSLQRDEIWKVLAAEYLSLLPPGLQDLGQDLREDPGFKIGVSPSSGDSVALAYVFRGSLAAEVGLMAGDKILSAGGTSPKSLGEFKQQIRRAAGSKLKLRVRTSAGTEKDLEVKVPKQLPS